MKQEKLFDIALDPQNNILPEDGVVNYYGTLFDYDHATQHLNSLLENIKWEHDENIMFGKKIVTKRKVAWYGDHGIHYTYSNVTKTALPWTKELLELKSIVEKETGEVFNSCLLNLYHDGNEGMGWHSDDEKDLKRDGAIASLSFGAEDRKSTRLNSSHVRISY